MINEVNLCDGYCMDIMQCLCVFIGQYSPESHIYGFVKKLYNIAWMWSSLKAENWD